MKKCTLGDRHKWNHIKNVQGLYQCECGAKKYGEHQ